jgi:hypothetical protein
MADLEFTAEYAGTEIRMATGDLVGTVAAVDEDANELLVAPNPVYVDEAQGATVDDDTAVSYDANRLPTPQVEVEEVPDDPVEVDAEEWPFTRAAADVDEGDDDGIRLVL